MIYFLNCNRAYDFPNIKVSFTRLRAALPAFLFNQRNTPSLSVSYVTGAFSPKKRDVPRFVLGEKEGRDLLVPLMIRLVLPVVHPILRVLLLL